MAALASPSPEIIELIKALGLDPSKIRDIHINMPINELATIQTTQIIYNEDLERITPILRKYVAIPKVDVKEGHHYIANDKGELIDVTSLDNV